MVLLLVEENCLIVHESPHVPCLVPVFIMLCGEAEILQDLWNILLIYTEA